MGNEIVKHGLIDWDLKRKDIMSVLQPLIDDGTLTVVSGQMDFTQCATQNWDNAKEAFANDPGRLALLKKEP